MSNNGVCCGLSRAFDCPHYTVFCSGVLERLVDIFACTSLNILIVMIIFTFVSRRKDITCQYVAFIASVYFMMRDLFVLFYVVVADLSLSVDKSVE